jgi:serine/threonine-protein kinase RsbW
VTQAGAARGFDAEPVEDFVEVRLPSDGAFLSVLRTTTASLAARLNFTLDEIEDMRIAVDEACALLLAKAVPDSQLTCRFELGTDAMTVTVSAPTRDGTPPRQDTFAWTVLSALAGSVDTEVAPDNTLTIRLRKECTAVGEGMA